MNMVNKTTPLAVGQIRKLDSIRGIASSRLVVIVEIDPLDATCLVFLIGNLVEASTPRDVIIPKHLTTLPYDIALMGDYLSRADQARIIQNSVLGQIEPSLIESIRNLVLNLPFGALEGGHFARDIKIGNYPAQKFDAVWVYRDSEAKNFSLLTYVRSKISLAYAARFYEINIDNPIAFSDLECSIDALRLRALSQEKIGVSI